MSKLVRDFIPDIIREKDGVEPKITIASGVVLENAARDKIEEEIAELLAASDDELAAEAGDVFEIVAKLLSLRLGIDSQEALRLIEQARVHKLENRGWFEKNIIWYPQK